MTDRHIEFIRRHFKRTDGKLCLLSEMVDEDFDINDPYGGTRLEYAGCAIQLEDLLERGLHRITALLPPDRPDKGRERH
jgi:protein-tyrosine-phosphatase